MDLLYAVQTAAVERNRCFSNRTKQTSYYMLTCRQPNISRMQKFGQVCYAYKQGSKLTPAKCRLELILTGVSLAGDA